jgi:hypothetical protein
VLLIGAPTGKHNDWEEALKLQRSCEPVIERMKQLAGHGLMLMMVLFDFLLRRITPLQLRARSVWLYTRESYTTRLECGRRSE